MILHRFDNHTTLFLILTSSEENVGNYWSSKDLKIMSKCTQYFIDNNAKMDSYNINNSLFSKKKKNVC